MSICFQDQNVFDSRKKVKATTASGLENKLVSFQLEKIGCNRALLMMYGSQVRIFTICHALQCHLI